MTHSQNPTGAGRRRAGPTVRLRFAAYYGALFLASGVLLLGITYVFVDRATSDQVVSVDEGDDAPTAVDPDVPVPGAGPREVYGLTGPEQAVLMHELLVQSALALGIMALGSFALGWIVAGRVLRPIRTITATTRAISASNLDERLALDGPDDELKELGDTIDGLLARLERSFESQRQFVANASHELRSPLARQRTIAQVALDDPLATVDTLRGAHDRVLAAGIEQERLIDALLILARGQAGLELAHDLDLRDAAEAVLHDRRRRIDDDRLQLNVDLKLAPIVGDPHLVGQLIGNLVENAIRHNHPGGTIEIVTPTRNGHGVLVVANTGPVVPSDAIDLLFQPFRRLGTGRTGHREGHGLGLSIVKAIAEAHDATLTIHAPIEGGLHIDVAFPAPALGAAVVGP